MEKKLICPFLLCIFLNITLIAQEIPDSLKDGVFFTYLSIENVWYGKTFKPNEITTSRYRLISRVVGNTRDLLVERIDYSSSRSGITNDSPENGKLIAIWSLCCDELFRGIDTPSDSKTPIAVEKWKSYNCVIVRIGSSRYLIDFSELPLTNIHAIDEKGNNVDLPPDY